MVLEGSSQFGEKSDFMLGNRVKFIVVDDLIRGGFLLGYLCKRERQNWG